MPLRQRMDSIWFEGAAPGDPSPPLAGRLDVDTVVVGGGITGLCTALALSEAGQRVAVLERGRIGAANTGRSTGNLYGTVSSGLAQVRRKWDDDVVREVVALRMAAIDWLGDVVERFGIDCAFARRPLFAGVAAGDTDQLASLEDEFQALEVAGLAPAWTDVIPGLPVELDRVLRIEGQAQFNPHAFARGLALALSRRGVQLFEGTEATDVEAGEGRVETPGGEVRARHVVLATHTPIGFNLLQAEMEVYRECGVSATLATGEPPRGTCWVRDKGWSFRDHEVGGTRHVVLVGGKYKQGEPEPGTDYHARLRDVVARHFDVAGFVHAWSAHQYKPADALPYIGRSAHDNVLVATGFGADGLAWGAVAARVLADLVQGHESHAAGLLAPRRFTPAKSAKTWAAENKTVAKHLVGDRLSRADARLGEVRPGEGRIVDIEGRKFAAYRDASGALSVVSPVCTHLGCHVGWNPEATTWDCPCHGSRFDTAGAVIEGPALRPLHRYEVE